MSNLKKFNWKKKALISGVIILFLFSYIFMWSNIEDFNFSNINDRVVKSPSAEVYNYGHSVGVTVQKSYYNDMVTLPSYYGDTKVKVYHNSVLYGLPYILFLYLLASGVYIYSYNHIHGGKKL